MPILRSRHDRNSEILAEVVNAELGTPITEDSSAEVDRLVADAWELWENLVQFGQSENGTLFCHPVHIAVTDADIIEACALPLQRKRHRRLHAGVFSSLSRTPSSGCSVTLKHCQESGSPLKRLAHRAPEAIARRLHLPGDGSPSARCTALWASH